MGYTAVRGLDPRQVMINRFRRCALLEVCPTGVSALARARARHLPPIGCPPSFGATGDDPKFPLTIYSSRVNLLSRRKDKVFSVFREGGKR